LFLSFLKEIDYIFKQTFHLDEVNEHHPGQKGDKWPKMVVVSAFFMNLRNQVRGRYINEASSNPSGIK